MGGTHNYKNSRAAKLAIFELGEDIAMGKLPAHFGPLSFVFTGSGNVSQVNEGNNSLITTFNTSINFFNNQQHIVKFHFLCVRQCSRWYHWVMFGNLRT